ncbi:hypothetical protein F511_07761 [Dorcoceras hygrometricum]|uniref:Uncharacterized protein n=1 Tax=Dorcoceras hygrometricum TaxID=472368 RepID=A0A2Z7CTR9_9LAMI|nr:hypothetical protein F511_07761 [Dorcoceras hygrometricum]
MAQYQILARKLHGLPGTGPEHNLEDKTAVAMLSENRRTVAVAITACGTRPHAGRDMRGRSRNQVARRMRTPRATVRDTSARWPASTRQFVLASAWWCARCCAPDGAALRGGAGSRIQLAVGPQPLRLRNHNFGLAHRIMVKRLATSPHDPLGITDSACKNQLVVVSVQYGPFNTYIPIRSTTIGKSRVARDPVAMHTSWRSNSDITSVTRQTHLPKTHPVLCPEIYHTIIFSYSIGHPRIKASGESSTTKHQLLHASGPHPIPPPNDPK